MDDDLNEAATFVNIKRGGQTLQDSAGYLYLKSKSCLAKDRIYWYCKECNNSACLAKAITKPSVNLIIAKDRHDHGNNMLETKAREVERAKIAVAATMPSVPPHTVLGN